MSKRTTVISAAAVALSMLLSGVALADGTPRLDKREHHQRERIEQGMKSGELTRPEAHRLVHGQVQLRKMERHAKADGDVTARERARLEWKADKQSARIYRQKHDAQTRN
ncbi:MAG: hypothetical protein CMLOHMNK_02225 [Steroidobacteraceae bacterium]|nr:hypothetical protein [Steroidobacteraceae bacterium]